MKKTVVGLLVTFVLSACAPQSTPGPIIPPEVATERSATNQAFQASLPTLTPTYAPRRPPDYARFWLGQYNGTVDSYRTNVTNFNEAYCDNSQLKVDIIPWPYKTHSGGTLPDLVFSYGVGGCSRLHFYLVIPNDMNKVPNLYVGRNRIVMNPSEAHPFSIILNRVKGPFEGVAIQGDVRAYDVDEMGTVHLVLHAFPFYAPATELEYGDSGTPPSITSEEVERVQSVYLSVASGEIGQQEAQARLQAISSEIGPKALTFIVRNFPVYNTDTSEWLRFEDYAVESALDSGVDPDSRLAQDPVGTTIDLMYGNPSDQEIIDWLGLDDELSP